jgi:hypothetical protein
MTSSELKSVVLTTTETGGGLYTHGKRHIYMLLGLPYLLFRFDSLTIRSSVSAKSTQPRLAKKGNQLLLHMEPVLPCRIELHDRLRPPLGTLIAKKKVNSNLLFSEAGIRDPEQSLRKTRRSHLYMYLSLLLTRAAHRNRTSLSYTTAPPNCSYLLLHTWAETLCVACPKKRDPKTTQRRTMDVKDTCEKGERKDTMTKPLLRGSVEARCLNGSEAAERTCDLSPT